MSAGGSEGEWAELSGVGAARAGVDEGRSDTGAAEPPSGDLFQAPFLPGVYVGSVLSTWACLYWYTCVRPGGDTKEG